MAKPPLVRTRLASNDRPLRPSRESRFVRALSPCCLCPGDCNCLLLAPRALLHKGVNAPIVEAGDVRRE
eukprot:8951693-Alexandrium_andersonii.AAC.1